jgi:hypothetical protein
MGSLRRENIRSATDSALCQAVRAGKVSGAPIEDFEPVELSPHQRLVGRGRFDVDNDGTLDDVGIVDYGEDSGAGCGHEYRASWPVKLDANGMPAIAAAFNEKANNIAGSDDESRVFIFRGTTYFERRSRPAVDGVPVHEVWKLTTSAPLQACVFDVVAYGISK